MNMQLVDRETGEMVKVGSIAGLTPAQVLQQAKKEEETYQLLCQQYLTEDDYENIKGKRFKKKSAWRKLGRAQKVSTEILEERKEELSNGYFAYHFKVRAHSSLWGNYADGVGSCSSDETKDKDTGETIVKTIHNTRATAETRATNRAIANLIGAGEVSAEEINDKEHKLTWIKPPENIKNDWTATDKQLGRLNTIAANKAGIKDEDKKHQWYSLLFGVQSAKDLGKEAYNYLCDYFFPNYKEIEANFKDDVTKFVEERKKQIIKQGEQAIKEL